ncbi:MAG TPA: class I SAM-dependent methyltransferase [Reyranella sp.]|nr:class I SAM-dependent methyltransferase [Reyranella sp.]
MSLRALKAIAKSGWHRSFRLLQRAGVNVLPEHFYSAVPNLAELERRQDWRKPRTMYGIGQRDIDGQVALLGEWLGPHKEVLQGRSVHREAFVGGGADGGYGEIEAEVLFGFVATAKPNRVTQVGCGVSTAILLTAAERAHYKPEVTCLEPYPSAWLQEQTRAGRIKLVDRPAQMVDFDAIADLGAGDLLFIDSTHAVKPGSEVNYLIHEVLPRLRPGVWVHFHDIYFPYDYARDTLDGDMLFPQESGLLYAFLAGNPRFRVEVSLSMIHYARPVALKKLIAKYEPSASVDGLHAEGGRHFPSACWLRVMPD